jgi:hypothetical protein
MSHPFLIPAWFFNYVILFDLAFAIITFIVGLFAFKIYKLSNQKQSKLFGIAFIFISIHYFIQSFLNYSIISKLNENICNFMKLESVNYFNTLGTYSHMILLMIGLITLVYMTLKIKSPEVYSLFLIISFIPILFASNKLFLFYALSSLFLIYISIHYLKNYINNKQPKTLLVLIAFLFLLFGSIHFIFSVDHSTYYIIGHFLELIAYILILINLILVLKNG